MFRAARKRWPWRAPQPRFNLIVTNLAGGGHGRGATRRARSKAPDLDVPVVVLAYDYREIKNLRRSQSGHRHRPDLPVAGQCPHPDRDRQVHRRQAQRPARHAQAMGVPVMLLVEDNIRYYSSFLPVIYTELITQSRRVISEGLNVAHKLVRLRARPKILLCFQTTKRPSSRCMHYRDYLLGIDCPTWSSARRRAAPRRRLRAGAHGPRIGARRSDRAAIQPHRTSGARRAPKGSRFCASARPPCWRICGDFLTEQFSLRRFRVPPAGRHRGGARARPERAGGAAARGAGGEHRLSRRAQPLFPLADGKDRVCAGAETAARARFPTTPASKTCGTNLLDSIAEYRREQSQVLIGDFARATFKPTDAFFLRIGGGSLGGKARGLAFVRHLLHKHTMAQRVSPVSASPCRRRWCWPPTCSTSSCKRTIC